MNTNTHIIPQSNPNTQFTYAAAFEEAFVPGGPCRFCGKPAEPCTTPPVCPAHLDIILIISKLQREDQPVNCATALEILRCGQANGGQWTLTEDTLPALLADFLKQTGREERP